MRFFPWSSFTPLELSPMLWLSDTGSSAGQWDDLSGNGRHATQGTGASQPAIVTNSINGKQVRRFDGVNDVMNGNQILTSANFSSFVVAKGVAQNNRIVFAQRSSGAVVGRTLFCATDNAGSFNLHRLFFNNGTSYSVRSTTTAWNNTAKLFYSESDGSGNSHVRINGGNAEGSLTGQNWTPETSGYLIGALDTVSNPFAGDVAEIIITPKLTDSNRTRVETYLRNKYALY